MASFHTTSRRTAVAGVLAAGSLAVLWLACMVPSGRIGLTGAYARSELDGRPYAASGAWRGADVFEIEARCVEFVSGSTLRLRFAPEGLLLSVTSALPNAGEARYALVPAR